MCSNAPLGFFFEGSLKPKHSENERVAIFIGSMLSVRDLLWPTAASVGSYSKSEMLGLYLACIDVAASLTRPNHRAYLQTKYLIRS